MEEEVKREMRDFNLVSEMEEEDGQKSDLEHLLLQAEFVIMTSMADLK